MSPEHLKKKEFRVQSEAALHLAATLLPLASATDKLEAGRPSKYDFRLCLLSKPEEVCFSSDGSVLLIHGRTFGLTSAGQQMVLTVFSRLDDLSTKRR